MNTYIILMNPGTEESLRDKFRDEPDKITGIEGISMTELKITINYNDQSLIGMIQHLPGVTSVMLESIVTSVKTILADNTDVIESGGIEYVISVKRAPKATDTFRVSVHYVNDAEGVFDVDINAKTVIPR